MVKSTDADPVQAAMIDGSSYLLFVLACVALILVPGPAQALVLAKTLSGGRKAGVLSAVGLNVGTLVHTLAAALGISAILTTSALAFSVVKYLGAAYLVWLGIRSLRSPAPPATPEAPWPSGSASSLVQGVTAGVLNPKVALFFLAFLPQFVDPGRGHVLVQFLVLGATMAVLDTLYELALVCVFARLRGRYLADPRVSRWQSRVSGVVLVALGLRLASQGR